MSSWSGTVKDIEIIGERKAPLICEGDVSSLEGYGISVQMYTGQLQGRTIFQAAYQAMGIRVWGTPHTTREGAKGTLVEVIEHVEEDHPGYDLLPKRV